MAEEDSIAFEAERLHEADTPSPISRRRVGTKCGVMRLRRVQLSLAVGTICVALLLTPSVVQTIRTHTDHFAGQVFSPATPVADFSLTDQQGVPWRLGDQRGKAILIYFGYTHCPDVCPATLSLFHDVAKQLGGDANRVRFVFITIDPDRDTPGVLGQYLNAFNPSFIGLTGTAAQLAPVHQSFGIFRKQGVSATATDLDATFTHTSNVFGIDPHGNLRVVHDYGDATEAFTHDARLLLKY